MSKRAEVLVRGLIEDREGRILLVRHISRQWWFFPGGHLERGESAAECLQRELQEEGELEVRLTSLIAVVEHRYREAGEDRVELNLFFSARATGAIGAVEEDLEFRWIGVDELEGLEVLPESLKDVALASSRHSPVAIVLEGLTSDTEPDVS